MKIAVIGSRTLSVDLESYIPPECTTIVSGGAGGIDTCAAEFAKAKGDAFESLGRTGAASRLDRALRWTGCGGVAFPKKARGAGEAA